VTDSSRFLDLAAVALARSDGVRLVHRGDVLAASSPWDGWDQVLVADGIGAPPAIFVFANADGLGVPEAQAKINELVENLRLRTRPSPVPVNLTAVFVFDQIQPADARRISRLAPQAYYAEISPHTLVVDLGRATVYGRRALGLAPSGVAGRLKGAAVAARGGEHVDPYEMARAERQAQTTREEFVSRMSTRTPVVTYAVLALIVGVFLLEYQSSNGRFGARTLLEYGAMKPSLVNHGEVWLLLTLMFVHLSILHILFNGIALYSLGTFVERIYGSLRYAVIYFVSGLGASLASYLYMVLAHENIISGGASGAIFGIAGVVMVMGVLGDSVVPRAVAIQLSLSMLVLVVLNIAFDFTTPEIDWRAHVGGLIVGMILGYFLAPRQEPQPLTV
jgi:membrane associated rhomboid family serine protease